MKKTICILAALLLALCVLSSCKGGGGGSSGSSSGTSSSAEPKAVSMWTTADASGNMTVIGFMDNNTCVIEISNTADETKKVNIGGTYTGDASKDGTVTITVVTVEGTAPAGVTPPAKGDKLTATISGDTLSCNSVDYTKFTE